ncbi:MAG: ankyrin repeat domain-containing protein, partial [Coxiellaceae bacterium]|nr:ankyrin repeat domain-containing protein [Coxiellaceae bacterium]
MRSNHIPVHPDHNAQVDLDIFNDFLSDVERFRKNNNVDESTYSDIIKVIANLKFIKANIDYLAYAVEHQDELELYQENLFYMRLQGFSANKDKKNGVIRDFEGTSLHITTYQDPNIASQDWLRLIESFEGAINNMRSQNKLLNFAKSLEYDKDKGCIEARVARALKFAASSDTLNLDELFNECRRQYQFDQHAVAENIANTYTFFKPYMGMSCAHDNQTKTINEELITEYLDLLGQTLEETESTTESTHSPATLKAAYENQQKNAIAVVLGNSNQKMVQHWFSNESSAEAFLTWVKAQTVLQNLQIAKARCTEAAYQNNKAYIVRLSGPQYDALTAPGEHARWVATTLASSTTPPISNATVSTQTQTTKKDETPKKRPVKQNIFFGNELHDAALNMKSGEMIAYLDTLDPESINTALMKINIKCETPLHVAARNQDSAGFRALLDKANTEAIDNALMQKNHYENYTLLHLAAWKQDSASLQTLLEKASPEA